MKGCPDCDALTSGACWEHSGGGTYVQQQPMTFPLIDPRDSQHDIGYDRFERDVVRKLDRIIVLLEEIAGRRR